MSRPRITILQTLALILSTTLANGQQLTVLEQFDPAQSGGLIGTGYDQRTELVWVYDGSSELDSYTRDGTFVSSLTNPGEGANDADIDFATRDITLNGTPVPAGSLLFINGETDFADIYALDPSSGALLAMLTADFGTSHVVGGAFSEARGTLFLVADRNDATPSVIVEIDLSSGNVLQSFSAIATGFDVNFGDIAIDQATGNILAVSSIEGRIREFSPTGQVIGDRSLPGGVSSLSGIAVDNARGELFLGGTGGTLSRVADVGTQVDVPLASGAVSGDRFGDAVATEGNLFAVGRPGANSGEGEVIIYRVEGTTLVVDEVIQVPIGRTATNFGAAIALDAGRLVVGAPASDAQPKGPGVLQAAIYRRTQGNWQMKDEFVSGSGGDGFGTSVAVSGTTVVIGAPDDDAAASGAGAAHVFRLGDDDIQLQTVKVQPANPTTGAKFGQSVATANGRVAVGAPGARIGAIATGSISLFDNIRDNLDNISVRGALNGSQSADGDQFGSAVAMDADTLIVGSPGEADGGVDRGAAYVFDAVNFSQRGRIVPVQGQDNAGFGSSVAAADGQTAAGAPGFDGSGALFRFSSGLAQNLAIIAPGGFQRFGAGVALSADGLLAGAPESGSQIGAALASRDPDLLFRSSFR